MERFWRAQPFDFWHKCVHMLEVFKVCVLKRAAIIISAGEAGYDGTGRRVEESITLQCPMTPESVSCPICVYVCAYMVCVRKINIT